MRVDDVIQDDLWWHGCHDMFCSLLNVEHLTPYRFVSTRRAREVVDSTSSKLDHIFCNVDDVVSGGWSFSTKKSATMTLKTV